MCWCSKAERYQFTWSDKKKFVIVSILRLIKCWEKSVDIAKNFYLERDDLKLLKLLRKNYLDEIKIVYIDIASVKTLYIRLTLLRAQMSIFPIVCNVMRRLMTKSLHCTETTSWCVIACLLEGIRCLSTAKNRVTLGSIRASSEGRAIRQVELLSNKLLTTAFEASLGCVAVIRRAKRRQRGSRDSYRAPKY